MTRSGIPFQGAKGEGKTWISAASPHGPGAASAGEPTVAKMNAAVAAAANRLAKSILTTFLKEPGTAPPPLPTDRTGPDRRIPESNRPKQQI
ncbi:MAG TPA: hypothetical protein VM910_30665 [Bradyrhizobium sp.]|nr:hypothetical protein [Bradyrhizobium sp.]